MNEKLFSPFLFLMGDVIHGIGAVWHERADSDAQKLAFLQSEVVVAEGRGRIAGPACWFCGKAVLPPAIHVLSSER